MDGKPLKPSARAAVLEELGISPVCMITMSRGTGVAISSDVTLEPPGSGTPVRWEKRP